MHSTKVYHNPNQTHDNLLLNILPQNPARCNNQKKYCKYNLMDKLVVLQFYYNYLP